MKELFAKARLAMLAVNQTGEIPTDEQQQVLDEARRFLHHCIIKCAKDDRVIPELLEALRDLNPELNDDNTDLAIRDIADICRSLRRHKEGELRTANGKFLNAQLLFTALEEEVSADAEPWFK